MKAMMLAALLVALLALEASGFTGTLPVYAQRRRSTSQLCDARKDAERAEQMRIQADILARRKDKKKMEQYFEGREEQRREVSKKLNELNYNKIPDGVDPLAYWKKVKAQGKVKDLGYTSNPKPKGAIFEFPLSPIDRAAYDEGQRFDLRTPYSERGWTEEEQRAAGGAEPEAQTKSSNWVGDLFGGLFGGGKKKEK